MDNVQSGIQQFWGLLMGMQLSDYLDIIAVTLLLFMLIPMIRTTGTSRIAKVAAGVLILKWLTDLLQLHTLSYIISQVLAVGVIALVVLFQPELRRMIDHISNVKFDRLLGMEKRNQEMIPVIQQTVRACEVMSRERIGALIVFSRDSHLDDYFKTGTMIEGRVSEQLLRNIFFPKAALHDGAVIIRDDTVMAAGCVLPLSDSVRLHADLGTRHRAGVGMSEVTDAVAVIVSEETGAISVAVNGMLKRHLAPQTLEKLLRHELCPDETDKEENLALRLRQKLHKKEKEGTGNGKK